jgi:hypothetical protein
LALTTSHIQTFKLYTIKLQLALFDYLPDYSTHTFTVIMAYSILTFLGFTAKLTDRIKWYKLLTISQFFLLLGKKMLSILTLNDPFLYCKSTKTVFLKSTMFVVKYLVEIMCTMMKMYGCYQWWKNHVFNDKILDEHD